MKIIPKELLILGTFWYFWL